MGGTVFLPFPPSFSAHVIRLPFRLSLPAPDALMPGPVRTAPPAGLIPFLRLRPTQESNRQTQPCQRNAPGASAYDRLAHAPPPGTPRLPARSYELGSGCKRAENHQPWDGMHINKQALPLSGPGPACPGSGRFIADERSFCGRILLLCTCANPVWIWRRKPMEGRHAGPSWGRPLRKLAHTRNLPVTACYEEVCSGESIAARTEMQRLLNDVEGPLVRRPGHGGGAPGPAATTDQGHGGRYLWKLQRLRIITPCPGHDPADEFATRNTSNLAYL